MEQKTIRLLSADEIECRVAAVSEKGVSLLLYKDARVDQRILDETFGVFGWKRSHQCMDGNLYCTVEVYNEKTGEWVAKQDVGTNGQTEQEKSRASDSFKRACFNWGIGRELYTAPFIWIPAEKTNIGRREGRFLCSDRFSVKSVTYNADREIDGLEITNGRGQTVYERKAAAAKPEDSKINTVSKARVESFESELKRTGVTTEAVRDRYGTGRPEQMSDELYGLVMEALAKTKSAGAA